MTLKYSKIEYIPKKKKLSVNEQYHENEQKRARCFSSQILRPLLLVMLILLVMLVFFIIRVLHNSTFSLAKRESRIIRNGPVSKTVQTIVDIKTVAVHDSKS